MCRNLGFGSGDDIVVCRWIDRYFCSVEGVVRDVGVDSDEFVGDAHVVDADYGYDCIEHDLGGNYL
jgi:hypothetical protein